MAERLRKTGRVRKTRKMRKTRKTRKMRKKRKTRKRHGQGLCRTAGRPRIGRQHGQEKG